MTYSKANKIATKSSELTSHNKGGEKYDLSCQNYPLNNFDRINEFVVLYELEKNLLKWKIDYKKIKNRNIINYIRKLIKLIYFFVKRCKYE